jgi:hypothetical protein
VGEIIMADPQEFAKFYKEYVDKLNSAWTALATHGMNLPQFTQADARAGEAFKTLKAMHKGGHWSA